MMGMLYPQAAREDAAAGGDEAETPEDEADDPLSMATAILPSALGLSVCIGADSALELTIDAAVYDAESQPTAKSEGEQHGGVSESSKRQRSEAVWRRRPLEPAKLQVDQAGIDRRPILGGLANVEVLSRQLPNGDVLLTISVSNAAIAANQRSAAETTLFQVCVSVKPLHGEILQYPAPEFVPPTEEERELRIIYGPQRPYAAGHGIATDWDVQDGVCRWVGTRALPIAHVWRPVFDRLSVKGSETFPDNDVFDVAKLAFGEIQATDLARRLSALVSYYESWITSQRELHVETALREDADRIIERSVASAARMQRGVDVLTTSPKALLAFQLANRAMLMAMAHAARANGKGRSDNLQGPFDLGYAETFPIDYRKFEAAWRPFQLAFFLQILPSLVNPEDEDRELVDVIWFATGGGKTEAYLLASAFELFRRRLALGDAGAGVGVINRYTYRFLTADQFQRTAGVICAMEMIRRELTRKGDHSLGAKEFSIGLYVGGEVSPNAYTNEDPPGGYECYQSLLQSKEPRSENPFPIESCPSCGTLLVPQSQRVLPDGSPDLAFYGFQASANSFRVRCPEEDCPFHDELPIYFVDQQVYASPPSFLLGTIDKFAMLPWNERAGRILGIGTTYAAPSLIIQDELHLISGPLGTLAGIYEAAFETVIRSKGAHPPKVIASTATIRNAAMQCRRIYGRPSAVFPSPGLRAEDSFFSKLDVGNKDRSRLYAGIMAQGLRSTVAAAWAISATLQSVYELARGGELTDDEIDAYWTLVAYHNSKRELGRITNATRDEIPTRMKVYASNEAVERPTNFRVLELKAHSEVPVPQARQMLGRRHTSADPAIDIVPCTNIISVGVDIDRLGLMLVNGQPKLSAEYIQATSRVGRGKVPGLVLASYSPSKPRDRSHYEAFRDYHERFYSFVEPTSVTPGALPAIERALHAGLVTVVRHGTALRSNDSAQKFSPATYSSLIEQFETRLLLAYPDITSEAEERERISEKLALVVKEWSDWSAGHPTIGYSFARSQKRPSLLVRFGDRCVDNVGWHTLQSMRHVDKEILLEG
jgi:hypothetical protein